MMAGGRAPRVAAERSGTVAARLPGSSDAHDHLVRAIMDLLKLRGWPAVRVNQRPVETRRGWRTPGADPGAGDIATCVPYGGRSVWIECKTGQARVTRAQQRFSDAWRMAGAAVLVIRDVATLDAWIREQTT